MLLLDRNPLGEMAAVRRIGTDRHIRHKRYADVAIYTLTSGARFDYTTAEWEFWEDLAPPASDLGAGAFDQPVTWSVPAPMSCPHHNWGDCLRNCLIDQIPREMSNPSLFAGSSTCKACAACEENCLGVCSDCARQLWQPHHHEHYHDCTKSCADSNKWNNYQCTIRIVSSVMMRPGMSPNSVALNTG